MRGGGSRVGSGGGRRPGKGKRTVKAQSVSRVTGVDYSKATRETCPTGKWGWQDRPDAKRALKSIRHTGKGKGMHAYHCPACELWHIGHLPRAVREGRVSVRDYYAGGDAASG